MPPLANLGTPLLITSSKALCLGSRVCVNNEFFVAQFGVDRVRTPGAGAGDKAAVAFAAEANAASQAAISKTEAAAELIKAEIICRAEYGGRTPPHS
jgi:hypothetical protein